MAGVSSRGKARVVLGQRRVLAVGKAAPVLLLESLLLAHRHCTVPVDTVAKQCLRQDARQVINWTSSDKVNQFAFY